VESLAFNQSLVFVIALVVVTLVASVLFFTNKLARRIWRGLCDEPEIIEAIFDHHKNWGVIALIFAVSLKPIGSHSVVPLFGEAIPWLLWIVCLVLFTLNMAHLIGQILVPIWHLTFSVFTKPIDYTSTASINAISWHHLYDTNRKLIYCLSKPQFFSIVGTTLVFSYLYFLTIATVVPVIVQK
jgi:hypothetical protein